MKKWMLTLAFMASYSLSSSARVLLVSDLDDTLKISHVQATLDAAENTIDVGNNFLGMNELYRDLKPKDGMIYAYVSNAPASLMQTIHEFFLNYNEYPEGKAYLRDSLFTTNHKVTVIPKLIRYYQPSMVILIGDNGEQDAYIYSQVQLMFPKIPVYAFIHQVYSVRNPSETGTVLRVNQKGFATSVDLAYELRQLGVLSETAYQQFKQKIIPKILREPENLMSGEVAFPMWMDCRDYHSPVQNPVEPLMIQYEAKLRKRCQGN